MNWGERLLYWINEKGFKNQRQFAVSIDMSPQMMNVIVKRKIKPSKSTELKIYKALGLTEEQFFSEQEGLGIRGIADFQKEEEETVRSKLCCEVMGKVVNLPYDDLAYINEYIGLREKQRATVVEQKKQG